MLYSCNVLNYSFIAYKMHIIMHTGLRNATQRTEEKENADLHKAAKRHSMHACFKGSMPMCVNVIQGDEGRTSCFTGTREAVTTKHAGAASQEFSYTVV